MVQPSVWVHLSAPTNSGYDIFNKSSEEYFEEESSAIADGRVRARKPSRSHTAASGRNTDCPNPGSAGKEQRPETWDRRSLRAMTQIC